MDINSLYNFKNVSVLVAGDLMLDDYIGGNVQRISPEAPVPVLNVKWENRKLGGSGNVINNITTLTAKARIVSCIGDDRNGDELIGLLTEKGVDTRFVMRSNEITTTTKTRVVARNQQVVRLDREANAPYPIAFVDHIENNLEAMFDGIDVLALSDYGKGVLTDDVCCKLIAYAKSKNIPVFVDPKGNKWNKYKGATMCTPNLSELSQICDIALSQSMEDEIHRCALDICEKYDLDYLLVTRSEMGMSLVSRDGKKKDYPAVKKEVIDVSGAGDTVICTMLLGNAVGLSMGECCRLANQAASVVVSKFGTATVSLAELIGSQLFSVGKKIIKGDEITYLSDYLHECGKAIVFTNGCFDLVHAGHIYSLEQARAFGDVLIVGLNSDASVRRLKGDSRPIVNENDRAYMLQSLAVVDYVVIFDEDTPESLIHKITPTVLVKGNDYLGKEIAGQAYVEANGGRVELIELKQGLSTTAVINKICTVYGKGE